MENRYLIVPRFVRRVLTAGIQTNSFESPAAQRRFKIDQWARVVYFKTANQWTGGFHVGWAGEKAPT